MEGNAPYNENRMFKDAEKSISIDLPKKLETFDDIEGTDLLEDKRRTRVKSTGRSPSQVFMKESIFRNSLLFDDDETWPDDIVPPSSMSSNKFSQIVQEVSAHHVSRSVVDGKVSSTTSRFSEIQKAEKQSAPWMKELLARKHKTSIRGDEETSFDSQRKVPNAETVRKISSEEIKITDPSESESSIHQTKKVSQPPVLPMSQVEKKDEVVPKNAPRFIKEVESHIERIKQFENNMLKEIRKLEDTLKRHNEEEIKMLEILKIDMSKA